ncbi:hypothetical protein BN940_06981 [Castellaniella defragrans 65Phen]|uniref:Phage head-tail adaptor n=1 Tax=Castellaniella defragrans (strain DSM 12143 / CCUG 39792 / 65Phen) TaxID=1437824 RepID=W8WVV7_CASD6|nr:phage head closure protein [Castellaniella defragrans]CDM23863.1 hypothetical protein BN940_06981 [Castellaniella defragrans 65Phen]
MQAGQLDRRIGIWKRVQGQDETGQPIDTWELVRMAWANVRFLSGIETVKSGIAASEVRASVRIRRTPGIDAGMIARIGGEDYDIEAVLPADRIHTDLIVTRTT